MTSSGHKETVTSPWAQPQFSVSDYASGIMRK